MVNLKHFGKWISKTKAASKSMLSIVLVLCLLAVMLPAGIGIVSASAGGDDDNTVVPWDGTLEPFANYYDEDGNAKDITNFIGPDAEPYIIENAKQLAFLATIVNMTNRSTCGTDTSSNAYYESIDNVTVNGVSYGQMLKYTFKFDGDSDGDIDTYVFAGFNYLGWKRVLFRSAKIVLAADIDLGDQPWTPIGAYTSSTLFKADFDGCDYTITGLNYTHTQGENTFGGLFGYIESDSSVSNLHVESATITVSPSASNTFVGGIAGRVENNVKLINCSFDGEIIGTEVSRNKTVGGLVGQINGTGVTISNCWSTGTANIGKVHIGGIFGQLASSKSATLTNCYSTMDFTITNTSWGSCGGLFGHANSGTLTLNNCYFAGSVPENRPHPIGQAGTGTLSYTNVYYTADWCSTAGTTAAGVGITDANVAEVPTTSFTVSNLVEQLNAGVDTLKAAGTGGLSYWKIAEDGTPAFAVMPKMTDLSLSCRKITFDPATNLYKVVVSNDVTSTTVTATAEDGVTLTVNGNPATSGIASEPIPLTADGVTTITVVAERDGFTETYTINVTCTAAWDGTLEPFANYYDEDGNAKDITNFIGPDAEPYIIENAKQLAFLATIVNMTNTSTCGTDTTSSAYYEKIDNVTVNGVNYNQMLKYTLTFDGDSDGDDETYVFPGHNYLGWKRVLFRSSKIVLAADIDLGDQPWTPIGAYTSSTVFKGDFDGCDYTITGLNYTHTQGENTFGGLFGYIYSGSTISNVHIESAAITLSPSSNNVFFGGITGRVEDNVALINCSFDGEIIGTEVSRNKTVGGLVGQVNGTGVTISNCWSTGTANIGKVHIGGIIGQLAGSKSATLTNCYSTMDFTITDTSWGSCGGLFGHANSGTLTLNNCYFAGSVPENRPHPIGQAGTGTLSYTNVYYTADWCSTAGTTAAGVGITDANVAEVPTTSFTVSNLVEQLNDGVTALKAASTAALSYWVIAEDGTPSFAVMPELIDLSIECGTITFAKATHSYSLSVPNEVTSTKVTATAADGVEKITVNGTEITSGVLSHEIPLTRNSVNTIEVKVWRDGFADTYTISVTCWALEPELTPEPFANYMEEGAGTAENPYQIANAAQLYFLAKTAQITNKDDIGSAVAVTIGGVDYQFANYKGKYLVLTADIDWNNEVWVPIGGFDYSTAFYGYFDGAGHTVSNINCSTSQSSHIGFFATITEATIKDLYVTSATITHDRKNYDPGSTTAANTGLGGIAGKITGKTTLTNVHFNGTITVTSEANSNTYVGGLVGFISGQNVTISGCSSTGSITSARKYVGGFIGLAYGSSGSAGNISINGSYSAMAISSSATSAVGGLLGGASAGEGYTSVKIVNCHFAGTVSQPFPISQSVTNVTVEDDVYYMEGCYTVTTTNPAVGGAGIDAETPNARERSVQAFKGGTVTNLLNATAIGETGWKNGTDYPVNVTISGETLITGAAMSGAAFAFDPATFTYDISVPYSTDSVVVIPTIVDQAVATVNGQTVQSGSASQSFALQVGVSQKIYLQAKLGDVITTYMFKVTRREQAPDGVWDGGYEAFDTSDDKGTDIDNPIIIENAAQLAFLMAMTNGETVVIGSTVYTPPESDYRGRVYIDTYFELAADIKLNVVDDYDNWSTAAPFNNWTPIGYYLWDNAAESRVFSGILDGKNHTITGLYCKVGSDKYETGTGLFGATSCTIRNLHVKQAYVVGHRCVGGLVGRSVDNWGSRITVLQNCSYSGVVRSLRTTLDSRAGGLIGSVYPGTTINSCWTEGTVSGGDYLGGLVGWAQVSKTLEIVNSYSAMTIETAMTSTEGVAGLVGGFAKGTGTLNIRRCHFAGSVPTNTPIVGNKDLTTTYTMETNYYRADSFVGPVNEDLLFGSLEKSVEEFADGTVTGLLNDAEAYGDFWNWEDGENGYPVSDGVILVTDYRTHTDDSLYDHSTAWADKFVNKDGGKLKNSSSSSSDDNTSGSPITGEKTFYVAVIVLLLVSAVSVFLLARRKRSAN